MKLFWMLFLGVLFFTSTSYSRSITLSWDASPSEVDGYKVYYEKENDDAPLDGTSANEGPSPIKVGNVLTKTINVDDDGWYYFAVTAYDVNGNESTYSNTVGAKPLSYVPPYPYELSDGAYLVDGVIKSDIDIPTFISWKEYVGVMAEGEVVTINANTFFSDGSHPPEGIRKVSPYTYYLIDANTEERISNKKYFFVDNSYKSYEISLIPYSPQTNAMIVCEYGDHSGEYQQKVNSITVEFPEVPPPDQFYLKRTEKDEYGNLFLVFGFQESVPSPEKYEIILGKTFEGAVTGEDDLIFKTTDLLNTGQNEWLTPLLPEFNQHGVVVSIRGVMPDGRKSAQRISGYLPGNILGNIDDGSTDFEDIYVNVQDVYKIRSFLIIRATSEDGEWSTPEKARSDFDGNGAITISDYIASIGYYRSPPKYILYYLW